MILGLLKDTKNGEYRTSVTPIETAALVEDGHKVLVQEGAGERAGFEDSKYVEAGAQLVPDAESIYSQADLVTKVKELEPWEFGLLRENQIVFTCIHPAAHPQEVDAILNKKVIAFTAEDSHRFGSPNCEAAGKQGALFGLESMLSTNGGKGKFVSGLGGAPAMNVLILGAGIVGQAALQILYNLGANCTVMDINIGILRQVSKDYKGHISTSICTKQAIAAMLPTTDMVLNCVKWPKGRNDFLIDRSMLKLMEKGSVIVDISNDDNGAIESFHETTHEDPRYVEEGVVHFCVSNIPGAIANSTSVAYAASLLPHFRSLLNLGVAKACAKDGFLRRSLTAYKGYLTHEETSAIQNRPWIRPEQILGIEEMNLDPAPPATVSRSENYIKL